jgi:hypothetical protein
VKCSGAILDDTAETQTDISKIFKEVLLQDGEATVDTCAVRSADGASWEAKPSGMLGFITDFKNWWNANEYQESVPSASASLKVCYPGQQKAGASDLDFDQMEDTLNDNKATHGSYMAPFYIPALSLRKLNGEDFHTPRLALRAGEEGSSGATIGYLNCRGAFGLTPALVPGLGIAMQAPYYRPLMSKAMSIVEQMLQCRAHVAGKTALTLQQFRIGYEIWQLDWVLQYLSTDGASYTQVPTWQDPAGAFVKSWTQLARTDVLKFSPEPTVRRLLARARTAEGDWGLGRALRGAAEWLVDGAATAYESRDTAEAARPRAHPSAESGAAGAAVRKLRAAVTAARSKLAGVTSSRRQLLSCPENEYSVTEPADTPARCTNCEPCPNLGEQRNDCGGISPGTCGMANQQPGTIAPTAGGGAQTDSACLTTPGQYSVTDLITGSQRCTDCQPCPDLGQQRSDCGGTSEGTCAMAAAAAPAAAAVWETPSPTPGNDDLKNKITMPSSCNFASYTSTSACLMKYSGLTTMLNPWSDNAGTLSTPTPTVVDIDIKVGRCRGELSEGLPAGAFGVSGSWADALLDVTPCASNGECSAKFGGGVACFDAGTSDYLGGSDMVLPLEWLYDTDTTAGTAKSNTCNSNLHLKRAARTAILGLAGKTQAPSADLRFCLPDLQAASDSISANVDYLGDVLAPVQDDSTKIVTMPFLVDAAAGGVHYPGEERAAQRTVASQATYSDIGVEDFTNVRATAFKKALAVSLTADPGAPFDEELIDITGVVAIAADDGPQRALARERATLRGDSRKADGGGAAHGAARGAARRRLPAATGVTVNYEVLAADAAAADAVVATVTSPTTGVASASFNQEVYSATAALSPPLEVEPVVATSCEDVDVPCTTNAAVAAAVAAGNIELKAAQPAADVPTPAPVALEDLTRAPVPAPETFAPTLGSDAAATFAPTPATGSPTAAPTIGAPPTPLGAGAVVPSTVSVGGEVVVVANGPGMGGDVVTDGASSATAMSHAAAAALALLAASALLQ